MFRKLQETLNRKLSTLDDDDDEKIEHRDHETRQSNETDAIQQSINLKAEANKLEFHNIISSLKVEMINFFPWLKIEPKIGKQKTNGKLEIEAKDKIFETADDFKVEKKVEAWRKSKQTDISKIKCKDRIQGEEKIHTIL